MKDEEIKIAEGTSDEMAKLMKHNAKLVRLLKTQESNNQNLQLEVDTLMRKLDLTEKDLNVPKSIKSISNLKDHYAAEIKEKDKQI